MNCDLWHSQGRIFAYWTKSCLYILFIVLVGLNFVSGIYKLKPKNLKKTFKKSIFVLKT